MTSDDCTCGDAGACFVPAGHYRDCPQYEETHIVTDDSEDPEHADDCPGCMTCPSPCGVCPRADNINGRCYCDEEDTVPAHYGDPVTGTWCDCDTCLDAAEEAATDACTCDTEDHLHDSGCPLYVPTAGPCGCPCTACQEYCEQCPAACANGHTYSDECRVAWDGDGCTRDCDNLRCQDDETPDPCMTSEDCRCAVCQVCRHDHDEYLHPWTGLPTGGTLPRTDPATDDATPAALSPGGVACVGCGSADIVYENYKGQLFCCPCAHCCDTTTEEESDGPGVLATIRRWIRRRR